MNKIYHLKNKNPWAREDHSEDIDSAISLVSDKNYKLCLEVGTGLGHYAERASKFCEHVDAIDISPLAIERAKDRLVHIKNIRFQAANIRTFKSDQEFDLIILGDVLYYLGDVRFTKEFNELTRHISNLLSKGGRILMSNHISPNRSEDILNRHIEFFMENGLRVEKKIIFSNRGREWIQAVLQK